MRCSAPGVPRDRRTSGTLDSGLRIRLPRPEVFVLAILCFFAGGSSAEPILHIARAKTESRARESLQLPKTRSIARSNASQANLLSAALTNSLQEFNAPGTALLQRRASAAASPLLLGKKHVRIQSHSEIQASVRAGYGEIFYDKSAAVYGRNGTGWQEPGCGYLKIDLSF
jgi:hypothetical protein